MKLQFDKHSLLFLAIAALILWQMLLPGYVLTLDMGFVPEMKVITSPDSFRNFLPIAYLISFLGVLIPAWVVQKALLLILFFNLGYFSFRFLPLPENKTVRLFSALVYTLNPFVYSRFLAGHWSHLMAYALFPVFAHFLFKFSRQPCFRSSLKLFLAVFSIGLFSLHFLTMAALIMFFWFGFHLIKHLAGNDFVWLKLTFKNLALGGLLFAIASAYWLIPAMDRVRPLEQRFDSNHWQAFAASGHDGIGVAFNTVSLNGFWGEGHSWSKQFLWPQDYPIFWIAMAIIWILVLIGIIGGIRKKKFRPIIIFFAVLGIAAFVFSTGAGNTIFRNFNIWFYENIYFWRGFRDSQKFSGLLALSCAVFSGIGLNIAMGWLSKKKPGLLKYFNSAVLLAPVLLGFLLWGGFRGQLRAVWYPEVWNQAKNIIQSDDSDYQVLFLPWHGYLSLNFNNNLLVGNPARRFFGEKSLVGKSTELDGIYDQELSLEYRNLEEIIKNDPAISSDEAIDFFAQQNIKYLVFFQDLKGVDSLKYEFLVSGRLEKIIDNNQLIMYKIESNRGS